MNPYEYSESEKRVMELRDRIDKLPVGTNLFNITVPPRRSDYQLIGEFVQTYCFADLHARIVIDTIKDARYGTHTRNAMNLTDADVWKHLKVEADKLVPGQLKDGLLKAQATLEGHRPLRHQLAHWTVRVLPEAASFIIFRKQSVEYQKRTSSKLDSYTTEFAIIEIEPIEIELVKLKGHSLYLSNVADDLERNFVKFKAAMHEVEVPNG